MLRIWCSSYCPILMKKRINGLPVTPCVIVCGKFICFTEGAYTHVRIYIYIYIYIQVHLNKLECREKVNLFQ